VVYAGADHVSAVLPELIGAKLEGKLLSVATETDGRYPKARLAEPAILHIRVVASGLLNFSGYFRRHWPLNVLAGLAP
jgi:hypothetical protein